MLEAPRCLSSETYEILEKLNRDAAIFLDYEKGDGHLYDFITKFTDCFTYPAYVLNLISSETQGHIRDTLVKCYKAFNRNNNRVSFFEYYHLMILWVPFIFKDARNTLFIEMLNRDNMENEIASLLKMGANIDDFPIFKINSTLASTLSLALESSDPDALIDTFKNTFLPSIFSLAVNKEHYNKMRNICDEALAKEDCEKDLKPTIWM